MKILAIGEILYEFFPRPLRGALNRVDDFGGTAGGAPLTFACVASRLGAAVELAAVVGNDPFSESLLHSLRREGIGLEGVRQVEGAQVGLVFHDNSGDETRLVFYRRGAAGTLLNPADVSAKAVAAADLVYFPGVALQVSSTACQACLKAAEEARAGGTLLACDPNIRRLEDGGQALDLLRQVVGQADLVTPNAAEARLLTGEADPLAAAHALRRMGAATVAVTLERGGCWLLHGEEEVYAPAFRGETVEPTGAGDAFCAALSWALLEGMPAATMAAFANAAGAIAVGAVGHIGEALPTPAALERMMARPSYPPPEREGG